MTRNDLRTRLDSLDAQYPNVLHMPKDVRAEYNRLSAVLVADVWTARLAKNGTIHSHLLAGEKDGQ